MPSYRLRRVLDKTNDADHVSQEDEDAWEFYVLYEKRKRAESGESTYHFVGYTSVYPFWCYPDAVRLRLR